MTDPWICWNGRVVRASEVAISPLDHGALYGDGLFETMRAYGGHVFRLEEHLERLAVSAEVLRLALPWQAAELGAAVREAIAANGLSDAIARLTVLRGVGPPGPDPAACREPHYFVQARAFVPYPERCFVEGAAAIVASTRQNEQSPLSRVKSVSYLNHVLARIEARETGADEAILLNSRGEVAEGATSNLFAVCDGVLVTPPVESGCLPGIARAVVLECAGELALQTALRPLPLPALLAADEAFLTNSAMEVMPLARVGDRPIGSGAPGGVTARLAAAYRAAVIQEIERSPVKPDHGHG